MASLAAIRASPERLANSDGKARPCLDRKDEKRPSMLSMLSEATPILHTINCDGAHMGDRLIFTSNRPLFDGARVSISQKALRLTQGSRNVYAFPGEVIFDSVRRVLLRCTLLIEAEQPRENLVISQPIRPAIGGGNGGIQRLVRIVQPSRTLVVEVGQRPLLQHDGSGIIDRQNAIRVAD